MFHKVLITPLILLLLIVLLLLLSVLFHYLTCGSCLLALFIKVPSFPFSVTSVLTEFRISFKKL